MQVAVVKVDIRRGRVVEVDIGQGRECDVGDEVVLEEARGSVAER